MKSIKIKQNLIIFGIHKVDDPSVNLENLVVMTLGNVNKKFSRECILNAKRLGSKPGKYAVLVTFTSTAWKFLAFSHAADLRKKNIYIANDLTKEEQKERQALAKLLPRLRALGFKPLLRDINVLINVKHYDRDYIVRYLEELPPQEGGQSSEAGDKRSEIERDVNNADELTHTQADDIVASPTADRMIPSLTQSPGLTETTRALPLSSLGPPNRAVNARSFFRREREQTHWTPISHHAALRHHVTK